MIMLRLNIFSKNASCVDLYISSHYLEFINIKAHFLHGKVLAEYHFNIHSLNNHC